MKQQIMMLLMVLGSARCTAQYLYWNAQDTSTATWWQSVGFLGIEQDGNYYQYDRLLDNWVPYVRISSIDSITGNLQEVRRYAVPPSYLGSAGLGKQNMIQMEGNRVVYCFPKDTANATAGDLGSFSMYLYLDGLDSVGFERDISQINGVSPVGGGASVNLDWGNNKFLSVNRWNPNDWADSEGFRLVLKPFGGGVISDNVWTSSNADSLHLGWVSGLKWTEDTVLLCGTMTGPNGGPTSVVAKVPLSCDTMIYRFFGNPNWYNNNGTGELDMVKMNNGNVQVCYSYAAQAGFNEPGIYKLRAAELDPTSMHLINDVSINMSPYDSILSSALGCGGSYSGSDSGTLNSIGYIPSNFNFTTFELVKLNDNLSIDWRRTYPSPSGGDVYEQYPIAITKTNDGGYLCAGGISQTLAAYPRSWTMKIDACGYLEPTNCPAITAISEPERAQLVQFWPNPTSGIAHAILPPFTNRINIRDVLGRVAYTEPVYYPRQDWNFDFLSPGHYLLEAVQEKGQTSATRFVVQGR